MMEENYNNNSKLQRIMAFSRKIVSIVGPVDYKNQHINRYTPKSYKFDYFY